MFQTLSMTNCDIATMIMPYLPSLEFLDLSHNLLSELPRDLDRLTQLRRLYLRGNRLIPYFDYSMLSSLNNLRILDLARNRVNLTSEPLKNLRYLESVSMCPQRVCHLALTTMNSSWKMCSFYGMILIKSQEPSVNDARISLHEN